MKRIIALLMALMMILPALACAGSAVQTEASPAPAAQESAAAPAETEPPEAEPEQAEETVPDIAYTVSVTDPDGNPVPGVTVEFCSDSECRTESTGENGAAVFTAPEGSYTVHILSVPLGFAGTDGEFPVSDADGGLQVTLETLQPSVDEPVFGFAYYDPEPYREASERLMWNSGKVKDYYMSVLFYKAHEWSQPVMLYSLSFAAMEDADAERYLRAEREATVAQLGGWDAVTFEKVASANGTVCFLYQPKLSREQLHEIAEYDYMDEEEFASLYEDKETFLSGIKLYPPEGESFLFETRDMDGNPVSTADVFAGHRVTMINCWATWCGPCKKELPQLQKLSKTFEKKGCQIIGLCLDLYPDLDTSEAVKILKKAGVKYLNLVAPFEDHQYLMLYVYPTSFFVDSEGNMLTEPVSGALIGEYEKALDKALSALEG